MIVCSVPMSIEQRNHLFLSCWHFYILFLNIYSDDNRYCHGNTYCFQSLRQLYAVHIYIKWNIFSWISLNFDHIFFFLTTNNWLILYSMVWYDNIVNLKCISCWCWFYYFNVDFQGNGLEEDSRILKKKSNEKIQESKAYWPYSIPTISSGRIW